jgi:hypothetical protein
MSSDFIFFSIANWRLFIQLALSWLHRNPSVFPHTPTFAHPFSSTKPTVNDSRPSQVPHILTLDQQRGYSTASPPPNMFLALFTGLLIDVNHWECLGPITILLPSSHGFNFQGDQQALSAAQLYELHPPATPPTTTSYLQTTLYGLRHMRTRSLFVVAYFAA